eukprot:CAMPEP_0202906008 /NCGR_PEP_ID=MMETSP1392-20130828/37021_1 /ASSEMBLY_ACC=CAM_ASM_000868 /TAXON_ID=225041 /ORGANISM="Chlamydomonas chlamydogama, Strain SAG 11-48b" /LENGTH=203 /DNA_ID=CAMNT_0049594345 /DNA_START=102 /DNA_END=709 /DNA_ORIENTATION=-
MIRQRVLVNTVEITAPNEGVQEKASFKEVDKILGNEGPLDTQEQERVIEEFEKLQLHHSRTWRVSFGLGALVLCLFFLHAGLSQHAYPWQLRYVGEFQSVVSHSGAVGMLLLQALGLGSTALAMLLGVPRPGDRERGCMPPALQNKLALLAGSCLTGVGAVYWSLKMREMVTRYGAAGWKPELLWVPLAPLAWCLLCHYVVAS